MVQRHGPIHLNHIRRIVMGINLPSDRRPALEWLEGHIVGWNTNFASIGLTSAQVLDLAQDIANSRSTFTTVQTSRAAARADTQDWYDSIDALHKKAAGLITTIKSYAATSGTSAAVYAAADMTPRSNPSPTPAPDQPTSVLATLQPNGSVTVSFDGKGPGGTVYQVYRKLVTESNFSLIGTVGAKTKEFNDPTVPSAIASAMYQIRAQHGEKFSLFSASTSVIFGTAQGAGAAQAA
jgi:hypothetical protein